jgi:hypothetical protein
MKPDSGEIETTGRGLLPDLVAIWRSSPLAPRVVLGLAALCTLAVALAIAALPVDTYLRTLAIDDALYYPVIAFSIASGDGSSIDGGVTFTNGYHPLWC